MYLYIEIGTFFFVRTENSKLINVHDREGGLLLRKSSDTYLVIQSSGNLALDNVSKT